MTVAQPRYSLFPAQRPIVGKRATHFRLVATRLLRRGSWRMALRASVNWIRAAAIDNRPGAIEASVRSESKARRPSEWSRWIAQPSAAVSRMKARQFRQPLPQQLGALSSPRHSSSGPRLGGRSYQKVTEGMKKIFLELGLTQCPRVMSAMGHSGH